MIVYYRIYTYAHRRQFKLIYEYNKQVVGQVFVWASVAYLLYYSHVVYINFTFKLLRHFYNIEKGWMV